MPVIYNCVYCGVPLKSDLVFEGKVVDLDNFISEKAKELSKDCECRVCDQSIKEPPTLGRQLTCEEAYNLTEGSKVWVKGLDHNNNTRAECKEWHICRKEDLKHYLMFINEELPVEWVRKTLRDMMVCSIAD